MEAVEAGEALKVSQVGMERGVGTFSRPVFPCRSPNPPCDSHRNGLSAVSTVDVTQPRGWDLVAPVLVPSDRYLGQVEQLDPVKPLEVV